MAGHEMNIRDEAAYIVERALEGDARIVTLGPLLFFSTDTGDAWVLDPADHLALCLARDGDPSPASITETPDRFMIEWNASYVLDGAIFLDRLLVYKILAKLDRIPGASAMLPRHLVV